MAGLINSTPRTLEIVNAEGVAAPRDGTIFNAQYSDGSVTKVRWGDDRQDWEGALSDGRWRSLEYLRGRARPTTWWPVAASFDVDERTGVLLAKLQRKFGVDTNAAVISRALALANIASDHAGPDNTVTISGDGQESVKVSLVE